MSRKKILENKSVFLVLATLFIIGIISMVGVFAYRGDPNVKGPNYNAEIHEQLEEAIESGDYNAWINIRKENNLPMNGRIFQVINAENFDKYRELHNAMESGDYETANRIRTELGLGQGIMKRGKDSNQVRMLGQGRVSRGYSGNCPIQN